MGTDKNVIKDEEARNAILANSSKYYEKKRGLVDDPIIVVKEGETYRILDGNGRALYRLAKSNFNLEDEIDAFIGECANISNICIPFGILHFIEDYPNKEELEAKILGQLLSK